MESVVAPTIIPGEMVNLQKVNLPNIHSIPKMTKKAVGIFGMLTFWGVDHSS